MSARSLRLTAPVAPEHEAQIACARMLAQVLRPDVCWTAVDHANARDKLTGAIRKARGVKAGIPDFLFWHYGRGFAIEFKRADGVLSDAQRAFLRTLIGAEVEVAVCWNSVQVFQKVVEWGLARRARIAA